MMNKANAINLVKVVLISTILLQIQGCLITSPFWGYRPSSTTAPIPFQVWTYYNSHPLRVQCATSIEGDGTLSGGVVSYINVGTIPISNRPSLDGEGTPMYSAASNITLREECWHHFTGHGGYSLANIRVTQLQPAFSGGGGGGTTTVIFDSFDKIGLECLGREVGKAQSWFGYFNKGCEKRLGSGTSAPKAPYIVLQVND